MGNIAENEIRRACHSCGADLGPLSHLADGAYRSVRALYDIEKSRLELAHKTIDLQGLQIARLEQEREALALRLQDKSEGAARAFFAMSGHRAPAKSNEARAARELVSQAVAEAMRERDEARAERDAVHARAREHGTLASALVAERDEARNERDAARAEKAKDRRTIEWLEKENEKETAGRHKAELERDQARHELEATRAALAEVAS